MADLALLLLTLAWGTTFTFVKDVLEVVSPGLFLAARFGVAAAVLAAVWAVRRDRPTPGLWRHGFLLGLTMLAGFALQTLGLRYTTPARSGFLTGLSVLVVPFIARFVMGRAVKAASWGGVALAVVGLGVLSFAAGVDADVRVGDLLTLGCAVAYALQIVWTSEWAPRHSLTPFVLAQVLVPVVGAAVAVPFEGAFLHAEGAGRFAATVAYTGVVMTAGTFFVMNWAQRHTTAVRAALIFSLEPVSAALFSHVYGGELLGPPVWIGGALIVLGVVLGEVGGALEARARRTEVA